MDLMQTTGAGLLFGLVMVYFVIGGMEGFFAMHNKELVKWYQIPAMIGCYVAIFFATYAIGSFLQYAATAIL